MNLREYLQRRRLAYQQLFFGDRSGLLPDAEIVLKDLRRFCGINKGGIVKSRITGVVDPYATAYRAGQRDVFLRIAGYLGLDEAQLEEIGNVQAREDSAER